MKNNPIMQAIFKRRSIRGNELMAVVALGHPAQEGSSQRKPLKELLLEDVK